MHTNDRQIQLEFTINKIIDILNENNNSDIKIQKIQYEIDIINNSSKPSFGRFAPILPSKPCC